MGFDVHVMVVPAGTSTANVPLPTIINPLNTEEWKREREEAEKKEPKLSSVKWANTGVKEGEEAELAASVQDIADGNTVTLQVFPEGKGPEDGIPLAQFPLTVKGGSVSARWSYRADRSGMPPEENPRFVFSAHCAWCGFEKSGNVLEVRLVRPEITKAEWRDRDGNATSKGLVGEPLKLVAETKDMEGGVTFHVYDENKHEVFSKGADIADGRAEAEWNPVDTRFPDDTRELKFTFEVRGNRCKKIKSSECQVKNPKITSIIWKDDFAYPGDKVTININSFEMKDFNYSGILNFYDKQKFANSNPLFSEDISIDSDEKEVKIELPKDKLNMSYKDESGFAKLC
uniref:hypothetical protein n=1 Tax=uncultured Muribaculum sp. TaxID=1918613 RepID=UPI00322099FC